ncbi:MAG: prepilin-type N-terminal cleavage/methylation domain-containing protein [Candidatus Gracilibacteria bacterium]
MRNKKPLLKGFTLIEALIASSIFALVAVMGATIFINISHSDRQTELTNALYEDARVVMEKLATKIRNGTIDYEEYYSVEVLDSELYGINRGVYGSRFYDPGLSELDGSLDQGANPDNLGAECINASGDIVECTDENSEFIFPPSVDKNLGHNPALDSDNAKASAFCDDDLGKLCPAVLDPATLANMQDELYLISEDGREKTIIIRQEISLADGTADGIISLLSMTGLDNDNNGIVDIFSCVDEISDYCYADGEIPAGYEFEHPEEYSLTDITLPKSIENEDFDLVNSPFTPISPLRSSITNLKFIIWPNEDPYKAFAEKAVQYQPNVTIIMSLEPSADEMQDYPGIETPTVTIQTTVSTGARNQIDTYPPTKDISWMKDIDALP